MMTRRLLFHIILTATATLLQCTATVLAAQNLPGPAQPKPLAIVNEDPVSWRREPFLSSIKKVSGAPPAKIISLKKNAGYPKQSPDQEQDIQLQGIMQADNAFHALINGRSVKAGDHINGVIVKEVSRFKVVVLNSRKEKITYDIYQGRIDRGKQ
jgi:hypothetical protein